MRFSFWARCSCSTVQVDSDDREQYGDTFADVYDDWYAEVSDVDALVMMIGNLVGGSLRDMSILECGVGTGRVAFKLADAGAKVTGIDNSEAMLNQLRKNDQTGRIDLVLGDMSSEIPVGEHDVAVVAFNTLFNLQHQTDQASFFRHVATRLRAGGLLVIEANEFRAVELVELEETRSDRGGRVVISTSRLDPTTQTASGIFTELSDSGEIVRPWSIRYAPTTEIDSMATAAGLELIHRAEDATGTPFTDTSERHVSVYRRPILKSQ